LVDSGAGNNLLTPTAADLKPTR
jgi:hypothetical protein